MTNAFANAVPSDALRVVLFGLPGAGKSSLLGAFGHIAETQPQLLNHRIGELSPNFRELRGRLDCGEPPAAGVGIDRYSFQHEPDNAPGRRGVFVFDPGGREAGAVALATDTDAAALTREMRRADAIVLAVDASAAAEELDAVFAEFNDFLSRMERRRGDRTLVGGLPVFLVLTKCDLSARPGETAADWVEDIEERKREVGARFHDFLAVRGVPHEPPGFGRLHLHLWATAVRRPALTGAADPTEPYGVAELFRQCLWHAVVYREQRDRSGRRLVRMTLMAAGALLALLTVAASMVLADALRRPSSELQIQIENLRRMEPNSPAERLRGAPDQLQTDLAEWHDIRDAPDFGALPADLKAYAEARLSELETYIPWLENLEQAPRPRDALTEEDLRSLRTELDGRLAPPRDDWAGAPAGRLWSEMTAEARAMEAAIETLRGWRQEAYREGDDLWLSAGRTKNGPSWNGWADAVGPWLNRTRKENAPDADAERPLADGLPLTYADVEDFPSAAATGAELESVRSRLGRLLDQALALGLIKRLKDESPVLVMPADLNLEDAARIAQRLHEEYPETVFVRDRGLPPDAAQQIEVAANTNYPLLLRPARELVLKHLREGLPGDAAPLDADTQERWAKVREWLKNPEELADWRRLAVALARLADPDAPDPVDALADFLDRKSFALDLDGFTLDIPDGPLDVEPQADAPLQLHWTPAGGAGTELAFRPIDEGMRVEMEPKKRYRFIAAAPGREIVFTPGDALYAELPLRGDGALRWDRPRSRLYPFGALWNEPVLIKAGQAVSAGTVVEDVIWTPRPEKGVPKNPDLMPKVEP
jgi:GTPase SAR1 family protein